MCWNDEEEIRETGQEGFCVAVLFLLGLLGCAVGGQEAQQGETRGTKNKEGRVKERSVLLPARSGGDWVGRGGLAERADGTWIYFYLRGNHHGSHDRSKTLHVRFSTDQGRSWTEADTLPDGSAVDGFPIRSPKNVAFDEVGLITCPNGDLLALHRMIGRKSQRLGCWVLRSTDGGRSWSVETTLFAERGGKYALDYAVAGDTILAPFIIGRKDQSDTPDRLVLMASDDHGKTWEIRSRIGGSEKGGVNETGIVHLGGDRVMIVCRTFGEQTTRQRYSDDLGKTWGAWREISDEVDVVQQPNLRRFSSQPGRICLFGRNRYKEKKQRNGIWWSDDGGKTWSGFDVDERYFRDTGYGDGLMRADGALVYLGYRGTDKRVDLMRYVLEIEPDERM